MHCLHLNDLSEFISNLYLYLFLRPARRSDGSALYLIRLCASGTRIMPGQGSDPGSDNASDLFAFEEAFDILFILPHQLL